MDEAEYLADRIVIIAGGRIVAEGTPATIGGREVQSFTIRFTLPPGVCVQDLPGEVAAAVTGTDEGQVEARAASPLRLLGALAAWVSDREVEVEELSAFRLASAHPVGGVGRLAPASLSANSEPKRRACCRSPGAERGAVTAGCCSPPGWDCEGGAIGL